MNTVEGDKVWAPNLSVVLVAKGLISDPREKRTLLAANFSILIIENG